jgi:ketosteroid isomerase-like protein
MTDDANLELLRDLYADWARGDFRRTDVFDPRVEFVTDYPERETYGRTSSSFT